MSSHRVSLADILTLVRRKVEVEPDAQYAEIGVRSYGRGLFQKEPRSGLEVGDKELFEVRQGDFILQVTFAWEGAVAVAKAEDGGLYGSVRMLTFRVDESRCLPDYLQLYFRTKEGVDQLVRISPGSAGRNRVLNKGRLSEVIVPLPPLDEQRRTVAKVERLAGKLNQVQRLRAMSILALSRVVNAQHVDLSSERNVALHDFLVLDEDRIPVMAGCTYPQVGVRAFGQGLFPKAAVDASGTTYKSFNRLYDGAVVLSQVKGWEGAVAVCGTELAGWFVSPEYRTFRCIPGAAEPLYLRHVLATEWFWSQLKNLTRGLGGRRERIRPEQFLQLVIPMPTFEVQVKAAALFEKLEPIRQLQTQTLVELDAMLPAVLERAFNGDL